MLVYLRIFIVGNELVCYYCGHEEGDECGPTHFGRGVTCQMNDPEETYYGDSCYVGYPGKSTLKQSTKHNIFL